MPPTFTEKGFQRRIIGHHGFRLDGMADVLARARGASVFDIGCNRGMVSYEFALAGAEILHGCDNYETGILVANEVFADVRSVTASFQVVDLTRGATAIERAFGNEYLKAYDFVVMLAVYHKLRRVMPLADLLKLVGYFADHCGKYFVWRGSREERPEFEGELLSRGFKQVHYSEIAEVLLPGDAAATPQPCAIWLRG